MMGFNGKLINGGDGIDTSVTQDNSNPSSIIFWSETNPIVIHPEETICGGRFVPE